MLSISLAELTSLKLGGKVCAFVSITEDSKLEESLEKAVQQANKMQASVAFIGAGTNILASEEEHNIILVKNESSTELKIVDRNADTVYLEVSAAMKLPKLLASCQKLGFSGLEPLSGIPGQVGGAIAMNAGSYGLEISEVLEELSYFALSTEASGLNKTGLVRVSAQAVPFRYRHCALFEGQKNFISSALFKLKTASPDLILENMQGFLAKKKASQPVHLASAGCVFKNTQGFSAGKLLDEAGFRGKRLGGMYFSDLHANFLINDKTGSYQDAMCLIEEAKKIVKLKFNIDLELEVRHWK